MAWEIKFIKNLQAAGNKFTDTLMHIVTQAGDEMFFMLIAVVLYWCISKKAGYKFLNVFAVGQIFVGGIKALVKRPRPYTLDGIEAIKAKTEGYSYPSGHSHNIVNITYQLSQYVKREKKNKLFRYFVGVGAVLSALVLFSRVYLGQHYPTDVISGALLGVLSAVLAGMAFDALKDREDLIFVVVFPLSVLLAFVVIIFGIDSAAGTVKVCGMYGSATLCYYLEKKFVRYEIPKFNFGKALRKIVLGLAVLLLVKEGLKPLFASFLTEGSVGFMILHEYFRYFLLSACAILACPYIYKKLEI